jgi:hypothetical protein
MIPSGAKAIAMHWEDSWLDCIRASRYVSVRPTRPQPILNGSPGPEFRTSILRCAAPDTLSHIVSGIADS